MTAPLEDILKHLAFLVEADTRNPPRAMTEGDGWIAALRERLPGFDFSTRDLGDGCVIIEAVRGTPKTLFNVHLDTVPMAEGWTRPAHKVTIEGDLAYGLGTCDTKGGAAVLMALAQHTDLPLRLLFNTDEEAGQSRCIRTYVQNDIPAEFAVIAEPTDALARLEHRGIFSGILQFEGESAHASEVGRPSAIHKAAKVITDALEKPEAAPNRLNFGRIEGGVKANMVAASCEVAFGFRAAPGADHRDVLAALELTVADATLTERFVGPAFPAGEDGIATQAKALDLAKHLHLPIGDPVDFWTEASLFAEAGIPSIVLGAGSITQAHNRDEFVPLSQLTELYSLYERIAIEHG